MAGNKQSKRPSFAAIRRLADQLYRELTQYFFATPEDRDTLAATCGAQLTYLFSILGVLTLNHDKREQLIRTHGPVVSQRQEPAPDEAPLGWVSLELARMLRPYLTGTPEDRDRLDKNCGYILAHTMAFIDMLIVADRQRREFNVYLTTKIAPALSRAAE